MVDFKKQLKLKKIRDMIHKSIKDCEVNVASHEMEFKFYYFTFRVCFDYDDAYPSKDYNGLPNVTGMNFERIGYPDGHDLIEVDCDMLYETELDVYFYKMRLAESIIYSVANCYSEVQDILHKIENDCR